MLLKIFLLVATLFYLVAILLKFNISCKSYAGYFIPFFSSDCYCNPDLTSDMHEIIRRHIGVLEVHQVETEDGYILNLSRIPKMNPKGVILLQHPFLYDSRIWVAQYNDSVAFKFWNEGYDVWMGNTRGTVYAKKHKVLSIEEPEFWNYSFHELGYHDNHAIIEYITKKTNSTIVYLGYSMTAASGLVYASTRPEEAKKNLKVMILLAPPVYCTYYSSPLHNTGPFIFALQTFNEKINSYSTLGKRSTWYNKIIRSAVILFPFKKALVYVFSWLYGWTPEEMDPALINMVITSCGSEFSLQLLNHFIQNHLDGGKFQMYNYGEEKNLKIYGQKTPLSYQLENIKVPIFPVCSENDTIVDQKDCDILLDKLPDEAKIFGKLYVEGMNHMDFAFGKNRNEKIYNKLIEVLDKIK